MANRVSAPAPRRNDEGWSAAAALVLLAVGFVVGRLMSSGWQMLPSQRGGDRSASAIGSTIETGNRGRSTGSPADVPAAGWKDILLRVYDNIGQHRVLALAAGITYYSILALFPAIAALVAVYGLFSNPASIARQLDNVRGLIPGGAIDVAHEQLIRVAAREHHTLGLTFVVGLAVALWSANAATKALFDTLNVVYGEEEKRGLLRLNAVSLSFTVAAIGCVLLALGAVVVIPVALNYLPLSSSADLLIRLARWPALVVGLALALARVYRFGPSRKAPYWRWITWGSVAAGLLWLVASALFSWYAANFGTVNQTYGSLGAAIGFMTWLWISAIAILLGAELDAEIEHQTARGTGTGTANR